MDTGAAKSEHTQDVSCLFRKLYSFGALSFCYRIPFEETLDSLKLKILDIKKHYDDLGKRDAQAAFTKLKPAIVQPNFCNIEGKYTAIQVDPRSCNMSAEQFKKDHGVKIASLLRLELQKLSQYQLDEILSSATGYYGQDMIIIDSEASFIYDDEYFEPLEFLESANIEKLELKYFDWLLDQKLNYFYAQKSYKVPLIAYIPLISELLELPVSQLAKLRVDISVITERLESSVNLAGDVYFSRFYELLGDKLLIKEWRSSINKKLNIIKDLYTVYQDRLDTLHEEILTVVIIVLIALEVFLFVR